jgi:hypothetical protein
MYPVVDQKPQEVELRPTDQLAVREREVLPDADRLEPQVGERELVFADRSCPTPLVLADRHPTMVPLHAHGPSS